MKLRVVVEIFFRWHSSENCILDYIIFYSDECLILIPADSRGNRGSRGIASTPLHLSLTSSFNSRQTNLNPPKSLSSHQPAWLYRWMGASSPKAKLVHVIHPVNLDLMILALPDEQWVHSQSRHCGLLLFIFSALLWWWWCSTIVGRIDLDCPNDYILLLVQAANKVFETESEGLSETAVEALCLRHYWSWQTHSSSLSPSSVKDAISMCWRNFPIQKVFSPTAMQGESM